MDPHAATPQMFGVAAAATSFGVAGDRASVFVAAKTAFVQHIDGKKPAGSAHFEAEIKTVDCMSNTE